MSKNDSQIMFAAQAADVFHFDEDRENFDSLSSSNGFTFWKSAELMATLGYSHKPSFNNVIQKAITACSTSGIDIMQNFVQDGSDWKLSRFACYLIAMNGDSKKPEVAQAQAWFATIADAFKNYIDESDDVERVLIRNEISEHEKSLGSTAKSAGVVQFHYFQNAGYRGMYNMDISQLRKLKGVPEKRTPLDFMGKEELAANLFRVTQTDAKLRNDNIKGQRNAENAAHAVGAKVRETMREISGNVPESLPPAGDVKKVRATMKKSSREFAKLDKK